jgi:hypothetical protein
LRGHVRAVEVETGEASEVADLRGLLGEQCGEELGTARGLAPEHEVTPADVPAQVECPLVHDTSSPRQQQCMFFIPINRPGGIQAVRRGTEECLT